MAIYIRRGLRVDGSTYVDRHNETVEYEVGQIQSATSAAIGRRLAPSPVALAGGLAPPLHPVHGVAQ